MLTRLLPTTGPLHMPPPASTFPPLFPNSTLTQLECPFRREASPPSSAPAVGGPGHLPLPPHHSHSFVFVSASFTPTFLFGSLRAESGSVLLTMCSQRLSRSGDAANR